MSEGRLTRLGSGALRRLDYQALASAGIRRYGPPLVRRAVDWLRSADRDRTPVSLSGEMKKRFGRKSRSSRSSGASRGNVVTTNYIDTRRTYSKRRAPKRVVRRFRKFKRRVQKVISSDTACQQVQRQYLSSVSSATSAQTYGSWGLLGCNSSTSGWNDIARIINDSTSATNALPDEIFIERARMDLFISNILNSTVYIDIYSCVCRRDVPVADFDPSSIFVDFTGTSLPESGAGNVFSATNPGVTPFQNSHFCSYFKVLNVNRVKLDAYQETSLVDRATPRKSYVLKDVNDFALMKGSKFFLLIQYGGPVIPGVVGPTSTAVRVIKTYNYRLLESNRIVGFIN